MRRATLYTPRTAFDVLRLPLIGRVLKARYGRLVLQVPFLLAALLLIYDGFTGPQNAAENLATVVPWVHYRGFVVLALLLAGNLFCMGCPFTLPRTLAKRLSVRGRRFPPRLRNKWLAIAALGSLFFAYEYLDMWASPALTAWVIIAYFVAAFALEAFFTESAFCKYVCPLGTFNFVYATTAPTQIGVKRLDVCRACEGQECVNGSYAATPVIRIDTIPTLDGGTQPVTVTHSPKGTLGCGTELFAPQIRSNLDCTLCLDCVRACPHDNIGLFARAPGRELMRADAWPKRWDIAFLAAALAFVGIVNGFGMIPPVYALMQQFADSFGLMAAGWSDAAIEFVALALIFIVGGLILPAVALVSAAWLTRKLARVDEPLRRIAAGFAPVFVPIGLGIWIAHYGFHFLIGAGSIVPVLQTFLIDHRVYLLGTVPDWSWAVAPSGELIGLIQVVALVGGFLWSMAIAERVAARMAKRRGIQALFAWALVLLLLMLAALWVFSQPMEMRGTILFD